MILEIPTRKVNFAFHIHNLLEFLTSFFSGKIWQLAEFLWGGREACVGFWESMGVGFPHANRLLPWKISVKQTAKIGIFTYMKLGI